MSRPSPVQFRDRILEAALDERGPRNAIAQRDLARYYAILRQSLPAFRPNEALLLVDALGSTYVDQSLLPFLWAEVDEAIREDGLADKWGVDGAALVHRLRADLSYAETVALVDALERLRLAPPADDLEARLNAVGLITYAQEPDVPDVPDDADE